MFVRSRPDKPIAAVTIADLEDWFSGRHEAPATRHSNTGRLSALFSYAVRHGWCAANPCDRLEPIRIERPVPAILTPEQAETVLRWTTQHRPRCLAFLVLCLFAGLRVSEARQTTWADVRPEHVIVSSQVSKVRRRRIVDLHPTAAAWLRTSADVGAALPLPRVTARRFLRRLRGVLGLATWPQNVLRHTAASFLLAASRDAARTALALGNSPGILLRHYQELVSVEETTRFWAILPA